MSDRAKTDLKVGLYFLLMALALAITIWRWS